MQRDRERQTDRRRQCCRGGRVFLFPPQEGSEGQGLLDAAQLSWDQAPRLPCPHGHTPQQAKDAGEGPCFLELTL